MKSFAAKILPRSLAVKIRDTLELLDQAIIPLFARSGRMASFYYALFSRKFDREHRAVLSGRLAYSDTALLRRNIHRLEKGLIMRPRRSVFAEGYIQQTVATYAGVIADGADQDLLRWARDVLTDYFTVVDKQVVSIALAYRHFESIAGSTNIPEATATRYVPMSQASLPKTSISAEQLRMLFERRRSVRWFENRRVPENLLREAINMASLAPSACNRQPYEFLIIDDQKKAVEVADLAMGTVGFSENIQCLVVVLGKLDAYPHERDRHCIYIDASLASMQLMLALETMGLSSCPINWPDIEPRERALQNLLALTYFERPVMLMAVGYADPEGGVPFSQKKTDKSLVKKVTN